MWTSTISVATRPVGVGVVHVLPMHVPGGYLRCCTNVKRIQKMCLVNAEVFLAGEGCIQGRCGARANFLHDLRARSSSSSGRQFAASSPPPGPAPRYSAPHVLSPRRPASVSVRRGNWWLADVRVLAWRRRRCSQQQQQQHPPHQQHFCAARRRRAALTDVSCDCRTTAASAPQV